MAPKKEDEEDVGAHMSHSKSATAAEQKVTAATSEPTMSAKKSGTCKPRVDILAPCELSGQMVYVVRLREDWDVSTSYFIKRHDDFKKFDAQLREASDVRGEATGVSLIPDLPENGKFGIRRRLSAMGMGNFINQVQEGLQHYMDAIMAQLPVLAASHEVQAFLTKLTTDEACLLSEDLRKVYWEEEDKIRDVLTTLRKNSDLRSLKGYWRLEGSDRIWELDVSGVCILDGKHRGEEFDCIEFGEGAHRQIQRNDGWKVDVDKTNIDLIVWTMPGKADIIWKREDPKVAEVHLRNVEKARQKHADKNWIKEASVPAA